MADLASIMAETNKSYDNSRNALNNQINAIDGQLQAQKEQINRQYAQQQKTLNNQRNYASETASMQAGGSGGSFGGRANLANRKYYEQSFQPAQTQLQTNQANSLQSADQQANANRLSLQNTLASLNDEANRYGLQRYDSAVQAEQAERARQEQLAEQRRQFDAQMAQAREQQLALQRALSSGGSTSNAHKFVGNDDYRGYLAYLAQNGDNSARQLLNYVGNDGNTSANVMLDLGGGNIGYTNNLNDEYYKNYWLSR